MFKKLAAGAALIAALGLGALSAPAVSAVGNWPDPSSSHTLQAVGNWPDPSSVHTASIQAVGNWPDPS
ncbi:MULTISPECIES: hypothetical protein [Arthrobacter]|uniref:Uncharacterized protein n=2 Tax=Arthrobacter TaxID=1663 RepID=A0ABU9KL17_9MICC|nr:hypothetical protein [Arthrobacter sp. YJM1]MDP5227599.1 hypothetical protein [Arthrobacter sp. YJM1]